MTCGIYFVDALGFFFQFFPCAIMCFVPFDDDKLKIRKRTLFLALTLCVLAVSALFPLAAHLARTFKVMMQISDSYMLLTVVLAVVVYSLLVREHFMKKLLVIYIVIFYAALMFWLTNLIGTISDPLFPSFAPGLLKVYHPKFLAFYLLSYVTILPVFVIFLRRYVSSFLREIEPRRMKREFRYATISTVAFLILMMSTHMLFDRYPYNFLLNSLFLFLVLNQAILYWMIVTSAVNRSREENALRALQVQRLQYDRISADMERSARLRHDMRHHWNYLYSLVEDGNMDKLREYLSALAERTGHVENQVFCENVTVNALLQYYMGRARDDGTEYSVAARCGEMDIRPEDLTVIIGNVMENALSACLKVAGERRIDVAVGVLHGAFTLEVTNSCPGAKLARGFEPDSEGFLPAGAFLSTRDGGGHGMAAVADLAESYSGSAQFKFDPDAGTFTARVILYKV